MLSVHINVYWDILALGLLCFVLIKKKKSLMAQPHLDPVVIAGTWGTATWKTSALSSVVSASTPREGGDPQHTGM